MAKGVLTSSELIEAIKRRAAIPDAQVTFDNDTILRYVNEEMDNSMVPFVMSSHQEYFTYSEDITLVAGQDKYEIPYRAIGSKLRDVKYKDSTNNYYQMTRIEPEDKGYFDTTNNSNYRTFYLEGDTIVLFPGVGSNPTGHLAVLYYLRPNELVDETRCAKILNINTSTGVITLDNIPEHFTNGMLIDFNKSKSSNRILGFDISVQSVDTVNLQITIDPNDIPLFLSVNDEVAAAGECTVPQIPSELHSLLCERVASRCMAAQGDQEGVSLSAVKIVEMENKANTLISNRSEGTPQKINNILSPLKVSKLGRRRFFF